MYCSLYLLYSDRWLPVHDLIKLESTNPTTTFCTFFVCYPVFCNHCTCSIFLNWWFYGPWNNCLKYLYFYTFSLFFSSHWAQGPINAFVLVKFLTLVSNNRPCVQCALLFIIKVYLCSIFHYLHLHWSVSLLLCTLVTNLFLIYILYNWWV